MTRQARRHLVSIGTKCLSSEPNACPRGKPQFAGNPRATSIASNAIRSILLPAAILFVRNAIVPHIRQKHLVHSLTSKGKVDRPLLTLRKIWQMEALGDGASRHETLPNPSGSAYTTLLTLPPRGAPPPVGEPAWRSLAISFDAGLAMSLIVSFRERGPSPCCTFHLGCSAFCARSPFP